MFGKKKKDDETEEERHARFAVERKEIAVKKAAALAVEIED